MRKTFSATLFFFCVVFWGSTVQASFDWEAPEGEGYFSQRLVETETILGEIPSTTRDVQVKVNAPFYVTILVYAGRDLLASIPHPFFEYTETIPVDADEDGLPDMSLTVHNDSGYFYFRGTRNLEIEGDVVEPLTLLAKTRYRGVVRVSYAYDLREPEPTCDDLSGMDFGLCEMLLGYAVQDGRCRAISGCSARGHLFFRDRAACMEACDLYIAGEGEPCDRRVRCDDGLECTGGTPEVDRGFCVAVEESHEGMRCGTRGTIPADECGEGLFCRWELGAQCGRTDIPGVCTEEVFGLACTGHYAPVCGCDGVTYGNSCTARAANASIDYEGVCVDEGVGEGGMCGGIAGFRCREGLTCHFTESYPDAAGVCIDPTLHAEGDCETDADCAPRLVCSNFNINDPVVNTSSVPYGMCVPAWMAGRFHSDEVITIGAGTTEGTPITVRGLATVAMNAVLSLDLDLGYVDGLAHEAIVEDLTFDVVAGRTGYDTTFTVADVDSSKITVNDSVLSISSLPINAPGDDTVNGDWWLNITNANDGGYSVRLKSWTLEVSSRWD
jgi:hypothetical protein